MTKRRASSWNSPIMWAGVAIYTAMLILFGWQTWQFVNWLFPDDQLLAKILTMTSFDILAAFWAVVHTFYRFASRGAKIWVQIAWALTFVLSLVASVLYLVIQFYFRFNLAVSPAMINIGYAVSILALVFNILSLMAWLILEHQKRHPRQDEFDLYEDEDEEGREDTPPSPRSQPAPAPQQVAVNSTPVQPAADPVTAALGESSVDPAKLTDLINMAVRYGRMTEEEARPLLAALGSKVSPQSQVNGKK